ncbi:Retrovirus-related Pol polyprotein from transposon RE2-like protein [Drosera capensis]
MANNAFSWNDTLPLVFPTISLLMLGVHYSQNLCRCYFNSNPHLTHFKALTLPWQSSLLSLMGVGVMLVAEVSLYIGSWITAGTCGAIGASPNADGGSSASLDSAVGTVNSSLFVGTSMDETSATVLLVLLGWQLEEHLLQLQMSRLQRPLLQEFLQEKKKGIWYLDSGCSGHMIGDKSNLDNFRKEQGPLVIFGGGKAAYQGFKVYQMDVKSAFLNGKLQEEVYVEQTPGFEDYEYPYHVYRLDKALYGLKQIPRAWYETLSTFLYDNNFERGKVDTTLFLKKHKEHILLVQIYVDDIILN